jgi:hypothetical protein
MPLIAAAVLSLWFLLTVPLGVFIGRALSRSSR